MTAVTRYVVTHVTLSGRMLLDPMQGRYTYATEAEAQDRINGLIEDNSPSRWRSIGVDETTLAVRACECWPGHFDPKSLYFDA